MAGLVCLNCGTGEHVATVASVPWCHNCFYDAFPSYRPRDELASRRVWRKQAAQGLPAPVAGEALWQAMGMLLRLRARR
ncbi:MAG: hypothetical protein ACRDYV_15180 [Acidimicrobiia bacterium]